jgi:DNA polymerase III subunit beta
MSDPPDRVRFSAKARPLLDAITAASRACESGKTKSSILSHLLIEAAGNGVTVTGTDLNIAISTSIEADIAEPGAAAVQAERLHQLVGTLPSDATVTVEGGDGGLAIKSGRSRYRLPALPAGDFPAPSAANPGAAEWKLAAADVATLKSASTVAAEDGDPRAYLKGVCLQAVDGKLTLAATDGHSLITARTEVPFQPAPFGAAGIIIPTATVNEIVHIGAARGATLRSDGRKVEVVAGKIRLTSRLVDAVYPQYRRMLPQPGPNSATINSADFAAALARAGAVGVDHKLGVTVSVTWNGPREITIAIPSSVRGEGEDAIAADTAGNAVVKFSISKMLRLLDALDAERVRIGLGNDNPAILVMAPNRPLMTAALAPCR